MAPKRTPVRRASGKKATVKVKADPLKEYQEAIRKRGVVESLNMADDDVLAHVKRHISTQSLALDRLLNGKGFPCGRISEISGPSHIGKSSILDHVMAQVQAEGGVAILADTEVSRDMTYSKAIGVDVSKLQYLKFKSPIPTVEDVLTSVMDVVDFWKNKYPETPVVIGWDALGGTATQDEVDKFAKGENVKPGAAAKVMAGGKRQYVSALGGSNIAFIIVNHTYEKIDTTGRVGKKRETYGGEALRLSASIRMEVFSKGEWIKRTDGVVIGRKIGAKLSKNRLGNPFQEVELAMISGKGIDNVWTLFDTFTKKGLIQRSGSWSAFNLEGNVHNFQGYNGFQAIVESDPGIFQKLVAIYQALEV